MFVTCDGDPGGPGAHPGLAGEAVRDAALVRDEGVRLVGVEHHQLARRQHVKLAVCNTEETEPLRHMSDGFRAAGERDAAAGPAGE